MRSLLLAVALAAASLPGRADGAGDATPPRIYRWIDENGIAHYTTDPERIPKSLRRRYGLPAEPLRNEVLDAHAPAPPGMHPPETGPDAWAAQEKSAAPPPPVPDGNAPAGDANGQEWLEGKPTDIAAVGAPAGSAERLAELELRIAELSAAIAADEDVLSAWIGDPSGGDAIALGEKPEFREIAKRLPLRIQELEALQTERDALQAALP
jgi:hypothetical protein